LVRVFFEAIDCILLRWEANGKGLWEEIFKKLGSIGIVSSYYSYYFAAILTESGLSRLAGGKAGSESLPPNANKLFCKL